MTRKEVLQRNKQLTDRNPIIAEQKSFNHRDLVVIAIRVLMGEAIALRVFNTSTAVRN